MITKLFNIFASGGMTFLSGLTIFEPPQTFHLGAIIFFMLNAIWLAGAIGLCLNKKIGWLICLAVALIMCVCSFWIFIGGYSIIDRAKDPTDGIGFIIFFGLSGLVISAGLITGLIWNRKHWFQKSQQSPAK